MKFSFSKKIVFLAAIFFTSSSLFSQVTCPVNDPCQKTCSQPGSKKPMTPAYNQSAAIGLQCDWGFFVNGSFIYWEPREVGLELGFWEGTPTTIAGEVLYMSFDYKPGFKVGLGAKFDRDDWLLYAEYTRLHMGINKKVNRPTDAVMMQSSWKRENQPQGLLTQELQGHWNLYYDMIDIELSRPFYNGTYLVVNPHFGMRGGFIDQKYVATVLSTTGVESHNRLKSDSWLIGPRGGFDVDWVIVSDFRIFTNLALSIFYQYFDKITLREESGTTPTALLRNQRNSIGYVNYSTDFALGLAWGSSFEDDSWYIDFLLGYDFFIFWDQNQMRSLKDLVTETTGLNKVSTTPGKLMLHGLTFTLRFDF